MSDEKIDGEWRELIEEARDSGMTSEEIREVISKLRETKRKECDER